MYTIIFRQIVELFTYSLKEHLLVDLITKEFSQWVSGMSIKLLMFPNFLYSLFFFFYSCCLFHTSCLSNPQLLSVPRCGSIIVDLALKFNSTTKEQDVIITLNDALKDGKLGEYSVGSIKGKRPNMEPTGGDATSRPDGSYGGKSS